MSLPAKFPSPLPLAPANEIFYYGDSVLRYKGTELGGQLQVQVGGLWYDCEAVNDGGTITFQISQTPE